MDISDNHGRKATNRNSKRVGIVITTKINKWYLPITNVIFKVLDLALSMFPTADLRNRPPVLLIP